MSIQKKFLFLIFSTLIAFIIAVGCYFIIVSPIAKIEEEKKILIDLSNSFRDLKADLGRIDNAHFGPQIEKIRESNEKLQAGYTAVDGMVYLPKANEQLGKSIQIINNLKGLLFKYWVDFEKYIPDMMESAQKIFLSTNVLISSDKLSTTNIDKYSEDGTLIKAQLTWNQLLSQIGIIDTNLESCISVLDEQFGRIDAEIAKIESRSLYISIGIIIVIIIIVVIVFLFFTSQISKNILGIETGISKISKGNLTTVIDINGKDELGILSNDLNQFIENLCSGMNGIKNSTDRNREIKDALAEEVGATIGQIEEIGGKTEKIIQVIKGLTENISYSSQGLDVLTSNVNKMSEQITSQITMVEQSSSGIHEMISSIRNVADITEKKEMATGVLVDTARKGGEQLKNTTRIIKEIHNSVDEISGTAAVIQGVASQTNLLAMNAAIEAAHAGDAGRGFAVVADEIRKLAETSSKNSKRISGVIKEVVANIEEAVSSGVETQNAFTAIDDEVQGVSHSLREISSSMSELNIGGEQILKAIDELQRFSMAVTDSSEEMSGVSSRFNNQIERILSVSSEVNQVTQEIDKSVHGISDSMEKVGEISDNLDDVSENLSDKMNPYKTSIEELDAETPSDEPAPSIGKDDTDKIELLFNEYEGDSE